LIAAGKGEDAQIPPLWDGKASERIVEVLAGHPLESATPASKSAS
jgi:hypothetical protein